MEKLPTLGSQMSVYSHPKHLPGYTGFIPGHPGREGVTFGTSTKTWLDEYKTTQLSNTQERLGRGGDKEIPFPKYYTQDPHSVVGDRSRTHERWDVVKNYHLSSRNYERDTNIKDFKRQAEDHREHYKDHTGWRKPVDVFQQPAISLQKTPRWKLNDV